MKHEFIKTHGDHKTIYLWSLLKRQFGGWKDGLMVNNTAALPEDQGSTPSTHMALETVCNSTSRGFGMLTKTYMQAKNPKHIK